MQRKVFTLSIALSLCLLVLLIGLITVWEPRSIAATQDKPAAAEVAAAIEVLQQDASNMARSQFAERKFQELSAKANLDGTVSVIVKLRVAFRPEGDLLSAAGVQAQRAVIAQSQNSLMKEMTSYDPASLKRFEHVPYVAVKVSAAGLEELRLSSNVIDIHQDALLKPALTRSAPFIGAQYAWANGHTGAGKTVAILDTGVDKNHPFLAGKVVSEACYSSNNAAEHATSLCPGGVTESTSDGSGRNCNVLDDCEHGTHVAGIAAGNNGSFSGVAKDAKLISIQVFSQINDSSECEGDSSCIRALTSDLLKGLERVYSLRDTHSIAAVNLSLGSGRFTSNCDTNPLKGIIDQLRSAGIATVISSGNDGYTDAISEPACISSAISVGATWNAINRVADFSNSAPFLTMLAPGDPITSSVPGGGFGTASGTSMAAPHVAGAFAILKQRTPSTSVTESLNYLTSRGFPITDSRNNVRLPRLNLGPPPGCIATNIFSTQWRGEYFSNTDLANNPVMVRDDGAGFLNFNFGDGGPSGACDVGVDNFSARWTRSVFFGIGRYRFTATADDGVRLYIDGQLKIDKWLNQPPSVYTADVFLTTGLHEIRMEYFEGGGGALAQLSWENLNSSCYADNLPWWEWKGEYYENTDLAGDPLMIRDDGQGFLNFNFGLGGPGGDCGMGVDNFSARWTTNVVLSNTGRYRFTVTSDDGVRLYIDRQLVIDKWINQPVTTYTADVVLGAGEHNIKLEYFEGGGGALAQLSWEFLASCSVNVPSNHWRGEYFNNINLTGLPVATLDDGDGFLNFDIGGGSRSAACGINADNFSARWARRVSFAPGRYRFTVAGDDGVRLYVGNRLIIDKWILQGVTTYTADVVILGGETDVILEYFEGSGGALARLSWELLPGDCYTEIPSGHWKGEYYNNANLTGDPMIVRNDGDGAIDFNFGLGGPGADCGLNADNFSARWTRTAHFAPGPYRLRATADDGVRVWFDGSLVIDKWFPQGVTTHTADVYVFGNGANIEVKVEYFEGSGGALAAFSWEAFPRECVNLNVTSDHWRGEYFNNATLTGSPAIVRDDGDNFIDFNFGDGGPGAACGLGVDNFSARWTRWVNFSPGTYRFSVTGDDGVRLNIGGGTVINKWFPQGATTYTVDIPIMSGGSRFIMLEYFEASGGAQVRLNWTRIDP